MADGKQFSNFFFIFAIRPFHQHMKKCLWDQFPIILCLCIFVKYFDGGVKHCINMKNSQIGCLMCQICSLMHWKCVLQTRHLLQENKILRKFVVGSTQSIIFLFWWCNKFCTKSLKLPVSLKSFEDKAAGDLISLICIVWQTHVSCVLLLAWLNVQTSYSACFFSFLILIVGVTIQKHCFVLTLCSNWEIRVYWTAVEN